MASFIVKLCCRIVSMLLVSCNFQLANIGTSEYKSLYVRDVGVVTLTTGKFFMPCHSFPAAK